MNRLPQAFATLTIAFFACALPTTIPPAATNTASHAETPTATHAPSPAITATPQANVTCGKVSLYLDPALADGSHCEILPEANSEDAPAFAINPPTTEITLDGYVLGNRFHSPHIDVFPIQRFQELLPDQVNPRRAALQHLIAGAAPENKTLPLLPVFNAAQMFTAQYALVPFQHGHGIRYITMYGQAFYPVNNHDMFLSYQGLTADGAYWVSVILPISHPSLLENGDNPSADERDDAEAYFARTSAELDRQQADSFSPTIPLLDHLIQSILIQ